MLNKSAQNEVYNDPLLENITMPVLREIEGDLCLLLSPGLGRV